MMLFEFLFLFHVLLLCPSFHQRTCVLWWFYKWVRFLMSSLVVHRVKFAEILSFFWVQLSSLQCRTLSAALLLFQEKHLENLSISLLWVVFFACFPSSNIWNAGTGEEFIVLSQVANNWPTAFKRFIFPYDLGKRKLEVRVAGKE